MTTAKLLDFPSGKRVFLMIQNQAPSTVDAELNKIGICFDGSITDISQCPLILYPGGSITLDKTVPKNQVYAVNVFGAPSDIRIGVIVSNLAV